MTRDQLEHLLRAAGDLAKDDEIVVIGSQAILGQFPDAPPSMRVSAEAADAGLLLERLDTVEADPALIAKARGMIQRAFHTAAP